jgi:hypothetical protein
MKNRTYKTTHSPFTVTFTSKLRVHRCFIFRIRSGLGAQT